MSIGVSDSQILDRLTQLVEDEKFIYDSINKKWQSYYKLWSRAYIIADTLHKCGCKTVIAVMCNGIDLFTLYFACMLVDVIIVPIDPHKSCKEIKNIIDEHNNYLLLEDGHEIFRECNAEVSLEMIINRIKAIDFDKVYMITYTSGSTGRSKGVIHNLRNLFLAAVIFGETVGLNGKYTMCHVMPMTYMAGILNTIILPFICGTKIVLLPRFDVMSSIKFWKSVKRLNITAFWFSPTMLKLLMAIDKKVRAKEYLSKCSTLFLSVRLH